MEKLVRNAEEKIILKMFAVQEIKIYIKWTPNMKIIITIKNANNKVLNFVKQFIIPKQIVIKTINFM